VLLTITDAERKELDIVLDAYQDNYSHLSNRRDAFLLFHHNFRQMYEDDQAERFTNNLFDPVTFETVQVLRAFVGLRPPNIRLTPTRINPVAIDAAGRLNEWMKYQWYVQDMLGKRDLLSFYVFLYGTGGLYHFYRKETTKRRFKTFKKDGSVEWSQPKTYTDYDDPDCEVMDIVYDFFPDDFGRDIDGCRSIVYRRLITKEELLAGSEGDDPWYNNKPDAYRLNMLLENGYDEDRKREMFDRYQDSHDIYNTVEKGVVETLEYWTDDELIIVANREFVLRRRGENPYHVLQRKPFTLFRDEVTPHELWGIGEGEILLKGQHELNTLLRARIDAVKRHLRSPYFAPIGSGIDLGSVYSEDRLVVEVPHSGQNAIQPFVLPDLSKAGIPDEADVRARLEGATGIGPAFKGMPYGVETATESNNLQTNTMNRALFKIQNFDKGYRSWIEKNIALATQFYPAMREFRMIDDDGRPMSAETYINYADFQTGIDVEIESATSKPVTAEQKNLQAQMLKATYGQDPAVRQRALTQRAMELQEVPRMRELLKTEEEIQAEMQAQMQAAMNAQDAQLEGELAKIQAQKMQERET